VDVRVLVHGCSSVDPRVPITPGRHSATITPHLGQCVTPVVGRMTFRHTRAVAKAISVRLDDEAERALRMLESTGLSRSEAIRSSLVASAERMGRRREVAREVAALEADDADRAEMLAIAALMESMRAAG
jgi:Arc/MetJ-type ribon-helix-helix transcriptional regulator